MTTAEIIELIIIGLFALTCCGYYVYKIIKNKWVDDLMTTITVSMNDAEEKWPVGHGEEKKQYVLDALKSKCKELSIPYTLIVTTLSKLISTIVTHWNVLKK